MRSLSLLTLGVLIANSAQAGLDSIPKESGWSGFLLGGVNVINYKSNFYSGDDSNKLNHRWDQSDSNSSANPLLNADIRYTFADYRTQVFLGNLVQDAIRFDFTQQLGIRQEIGNKGVFAGSFVFNIMPTEQWSDPFAIGVDRQSTDIKSTGVRFTWDRIWGSNFYGNLTSRSVKVDEEHSGEQLDAVTAAKLNRNGKMHAMEFSYQWHLVSEQTLEPAFIYRQANLDGRAHSYKSHGVQLTYAKRAPHWSVVSNAYLGQTEYDEANPIFNQHSNSDEFALTGTLFWHRLFGIAPLTATLTVGYSKSDSKISFYDSEATLFSTGVLYNF